MGTRYRPPEAAIEKWTEILDATRPRAELPPVLHSWADQHPDTAKVWFGAEEPSSWEAVLDGLIALITLLNNSEPGQAAASAIKEALFRTTAHCDIFFSGRANPSAYASEPSLENGSQPLTDSNTTPSTDVNDETGPGPDERRIESPNDNPPKAGGGLSKPPCPQKITPHAFLSRLQEAAHVPLEELPSRLHSHAISKGYNVFLRNWSADKADQDVEIVNFDSAVSGAFKQDEWDEMMERLEWLRDDKAEVTEDRKKSAGHILWWLRDQAGEPLSKGDWRLLDRIRAETQGPASNDRNAAASTNSTDTRDSEEAAILAQLSQLWDSDIPDPMEPELLRQLHELRARSEDLGAARDPDTERRPAASVRGHSQTDVVPYLQTFFDRHVKAVLDDPKWKVALASAGELQLLLTMFMIHSEYIDRLLGQLYPRGLGHEHGRTRRAPTKTAARARVKVLGDYSGHGVAPLRPYESWRMEPSRYARTVASIGCLMDTVRCSIETSDVEAQTRVLREIVDASERWRLIRIKSTLNDPEQTVKQCLVNAVFSPPGPDPSRLATFHDMVNSPDFAVAALRVAERDSVDVQTIAAACELLSSTALADRPITLIVEVQLYITYFLEARKLVHAFYKLLRAPTPMALSADCATHSKAGSTMGCSPEAQQLRGAIGPLFPDGTTTLCNPTWVLRSVDVDSTGLAKLIAASTILTSLNLHHCTVDPAIMAPVLQQLPTLQVLVMESCKLGDTGGKTLLTALAHGLSRIRELDLSDNALSRCAATTLAGYLQTATSLTTLRVRGNPLWEVPFSSRDYDVDFAEAIDAMQAMLNGGGRSAAKSAASRQKMMTLEKEWGFDGCVTDLASGIGRHRTLVFLDLSSTESGNSGAIALTTALRGNTTLQDLLFSNNKVMSEGVEAFAGLIAATASLQTLDLSRNPIDDAGAIELARGLTSSRSVTNLSLTQCKFSDAAAVALHAAVRSRGVGTVMCAATPFYTVLAQLWEPGQRLEKVDLNQHRLWAESGGVHEEGITEAGAAAIAEAFKGNPGNGVKRLDLKDNTGLADAGVAALAGVCSVAGGILADLVLSNINLGNIGVAVLAQALTGNTTLERLDLGSNRIREEGARDLAAVVAQTCLTCLILEENHVKDVGAVALATALRESTTLIDLNLAGNSVGDVGSLALFEALTQDVGLSCTATPLLAELLRVHASSNDDANSARDNSDSAASSEDEVDTEDESDASEDGDAGVDEQGASTTLSLRGVTAAVAPTLAQGLRTNTVLTVWDLANCRLGDDGCIALAVAVRSNDTVLSLDLSGNGIGDTAVVVFCESLEYNTSLTRLVLERNDFGDSGLGALGVLFGKNSTLKSVSVRGNAFSSAAALAIYTAGRRREPPIQLACAPFVDLLSDLDSEACTLTEVALPPRAVDPSGISALAERLWLNKRVTRLVLADTNLRDVGITTLMRGLNTNDVIREVDVSRNGVADDGVSAIAEYVTTNCELSKLNLHANAIGDAGVRSLASAVLQRAARPIFIDLSSNAVGDDGATAAVTMLAESDALCALRSSSTGTSRTLRSDDKLRGLEPIINLAFNPVSLACQMRMLHGDLVGLGMSEYACESLAWIDYPGTADTLRSDFRTNLIVGERWQPGDCAALAGLLRENAHLRSLELDSVAALSPGSLGALFQALGANTMLWSLRLDGDFLLRASDVTELAEALASNTTLQTFTWSNGYLTTEQATPLLRGLSVQCHLSTLWLQSHNLRENCGEDLANLLQTCTSLTTLDLSSNILGDDGATSLASMLSENSTLTWLNLSYNHIAEGGLIAVAQALTANSALVGLSLRGNDINCAVLEELSEALRANTCLQSLDLGESPISMWDNRDDEEDGFAGLIMALKDNEHLTQLDISGTRIGSDEFAIFAPPCLRDRPVPLELNLSTTDIHIGAQLAVLGIPGVHAHCDITANLPALRLAGYQFEADDTGVLFRQLQQTQAVQHLRLVAARDQIDEIVPAIAPNTAITLLDLSSNVLDADSILVLSKLGSSKTITTLNLDKNHLETEGAYYIAKIFAKNHTLTQLHLSSNDIGDDGAAEIAGLLRGNRGLTFIDLQDNKIGDSGAIALAEALERNNHLKTLDLRQNGDIRDVGAVAVGKLCVSKPKLTCWCPHLADALVELARTTEWYPTVRLTDASVGDVGAVALAEALFKSPADVVSVLLADNEIEAVGAGALVCAALNRSSVTTIDLSGNWVGDDGMAEVAEGLQNAVEGPVRSGDDIGRRLEIRLKSAVIGDVGVSHLARVLADNRLLTKLDLSDNCIGDSGSVVLAECLQGGGSAMKHLVLDGNHIGDDGAVAFAHTLATDTKLVTLSLCRNMIGVHGIAALVGPTHVADTDSCRVDLRNQLGMTKEAK